MRRANKHLPWVHKAGWQRRANKHLPSVLRADWQERAQPFACLPQAQRPPVWLQAGKEPFHHSTAPGGATSLKSVSGVMESWSQRMLVSCWGGYTRCVLPAWYSGCSWVCRAGAAAIVLCISSASTQSSSSGKIMAVKGIWLIVVKSSILPSCMEKGGQVLCQLPASLSRTQSELGGLSGAAEEWPGLRIGFLPQRSSQRAGKWLWENLGEVQWF